MFVCRSMDDFILITKKDKETIEDLVTNLTETTYKTNFGVAAACVCTTICSG